MYENTEKYRCGNCGNDKYNIYKEKNNTQRIITECTKCKSQSEISIKPSEIEINWGRSGEGVMAIF